MVDAAEPAGSFFAQEKCWLARYLVELTHDAGLRSPDQLGSQLLLLLERVGAGVLVHGVRAAPDVLADTFEVARLLVAAAGGRGGM